MKVKLIIYFLIIPYLSFNCQKRTNNEENKSEEKAKDNIVNHNKSLDNKNTNKESKLKIKVKKLSELNHNYVSKKIELISDKNSRLINGLEKLLKTDVLISEKLESQNIEDIKFQILKSYSASLKGSVSLTENGNTFPRLNIEEHIFKSKEKADETFNFLNDLKKKRNIWIHIAKEPNSIFIEENRIYFMISGGWYMMNIHEDLENKLKKLN